MSTYTQEQETQIVKDAMFLTRTIEIENKKLIEVEHESFRPQPAAPIRQKLTVPHIEAKMPSPPKTKYSYSDFFDENKILIIIGFLFAAPIIIIWFLINYNRKKNELNQELTNSPEYIIAVEKAKKQAAEEQDRVNKEIAERQTRIDAQYATDLENYNNVLIPNYKNELANFEKIRQKKIATLREDIELNQETLEALYQETKIISLTYRNIEILMWLYNDMSTSDHDIRYATELLDRERQLNATYSVGNQISQAVESAIGNLESSVNNGLSDICSAIESGNYELAKTRRNENLFNTISIVQRYNLNKTMKNFTKK